ncbi:DUF1772 domain-containing protein [Candidatus Bathyarchaeota archaeon]|nr:DUF1772 domain-containing protein [Candidatus Bathyarchaeota archaeon]
MNVLSTIAVPVFLETNTEPGQLVRQWARLYHYGSLAAPPMAVTTFALYTYSALGLCAGGQPWELLAAAGATTLFIVPFTLGVMLPTNNALHGLEARANAGEALKMEGLRALVVKWGWLHLVRSLFPLAGVLLGISAVL